MVKKENLVELVSGQEKPVLSVGQFLDVINELVSAAGASVVGEVTGWRPHPTGMYFSLKDNSSESGQVSVMDCYMSPYAFRGLGIIVQDGMEIKVSGVPGIYKAKGRFSFRVDTMELAGEGSLKKAYELLKQQLGAEGLFERKRQLPEFIGSIGVITSRTGAVIDDFRKNLARLGLSVHLYDTRVEGATAVDNIVKGIKWFNEHKPDLDVLAIMRGGGSLEDLQPFNNELVAREIFASRIPTICAIGHDRDVPIAQMVADFSPSTPTAVAIAINATWDRLRVGPTENWREISYAYQAVLERARSLLNIDELVSSMTHHIENFSQVLTGHEKYLLAVSPERQLKLGYSIITAGSGQVLKDAGLLKKGDTIRARLAKGSLSAKIESLN